MKKLVSILLLTLALGAFAFSQGGGGGGQGRGQRGGQRGGGYDRAGAQYQLVSRSDVAAELKITDDQKTKLASARTDMMTAMQAPGQDATQEERAAARTKASEAYNSAVAGILTADQSKRLMGIFVQMTPKNQALENPDVQSALGFTSDQTAKVKDLVTKYTAANRGLSNDDPAAAREARTKNLDTLSTDLMGVLTDDQKGKFTALAGDKFTPDPSIRGFGGGGGRGGRGGGGGGGGGNGGL